MKVTGAAIASLAVLLLGAAAQASPVRVEFSGQIDLVRESPGDSLLLYELGPSVAVGGSFSGFFEFDDSRPEDFPNSGQFTLPIPPAILQVSLGDVAGSARTSFQISLLPSAGLGSDAPHVYLTTKLDLPDSLPDSFFTIYLKNTSFNPLPSDDLPDVPWDESVYTPGYRSAQWFLLRNIEGIGQESVEVYGSITSLRAVPEPGALVLLLAGVLPRVGAGARRARSRRSTAW